LVSATPVLKEMLDGGGAVALNETDTHIPGPLGKQPVG
jgi:hypothetical protein